LETKENISEEDEEETHRFADLLARLPSARYSFTLSHLIGKSEPPEKPLREIADLCDCLFQRRLDAELAQAVHELSTQSLCWPLFVTAVDYQSKKPLAMCAPNLKLGTAIASNLGVSPRGTTSPTVMVRPLFIGLEQWRRIPRTDETLDSMRQSEEMNEPAPLDQLITEACAGMPPRHGYWSLSNLWTRKAALLPPLQDTNQVIEQWIDAAYAYLAFVKNGNLGDPDWDWAPSIEKELRKTGSLTSGLRELLRKGFQTLAGRDRNSSSKS